MDFEGRRGGRKKGSRRPHWRKLSDKLSRRFPLEDKSAIAGATTKFGDSPAAPRRMRSVGGGSRGGSCCFWSLYPRGNLESVRQRPRGLTHVLRRVCGAAVFEPANQSATSARGGGATGSPEGRFTERRKPIHSSEIHVKTRKHLLKKQDRSLK